MGIYNLLKLVINHNDRNNITEIEQRNGIYCSNSVYLDVMFKLIDIYEQSDIEDKPFAEILDIVSEKLKEYLISYQYYNKKLYVFIDLHYIRDLDVQTVYFKDFLPKPSDFTTEELEQSTPMMKKGESDETKVRLIYELTSRDSILNDVDVDEYLSVKNISSPLVKNISSPLVKNISSPLVKNISSPLVKNISSPLVKNISKKTTMKDNDETSSMDITMKDNGEPLMKDNGETSSLKDNGEPLMKNISGPLMKDINEKSSMDISAIVSHAWYRFLVLRGCKLSVKNKRATYNEKWKNFRAIIYSFPLIIQKMNLQDVEFFACVSESDYAIVKHIKTYNINNYPTIITNDTDLLVLLADVDCVVKIFNKYNSRFYTVIPKNFWNKVFNCNLEINIIKILCVMCGSNYNLDRNNNLKRFDEILRIMNVEKYSELTEDSLKLMLYNQAKNHPSTYIRRTLLAFNLFVNYTEELCPIIVTPELIKKIMTNVKIDEEN